MSSFDKKSHWENIYDTKSLNDVSWYQEKPTTSLAYIEKHAISKDASIIDVGGGDSFLVDCLLELGYTNITVLDISNSAINRAKKRVGEKAKNVTWIVSDILEFKSDTSYDFWHDRAVFHFITNEKDIFRYKENVIAHLSDSANVVIGTFSFEGPLKCSGIEIKQYSKETLANVFTPELSLLSSQYVDHITPFDTIQNFVFCSFQKN